MQQGVQIEEQIENFQIKEGVVKSACSISYEPELIDKSEVDIKSEITFYDDVLKILTF